MKTTAKIGIFDARHEAYDIIKRFALFCQHFVLLSPKKGEKHAFFTQKWLDHLSFMTTYLVTMVTDSHRTCAKMCLTDMHTDTENGRC